MNLDMVNQPQLLDLQNFLVLSHLLKSEVCTFLKKKLNNSTCYKNKEVKIKGDILHTLHHEKMGSNCSHS